MTDFRLAAVHDGQADWDTATPIAIPRLTHQQRVVFACLRRHIAVHGYPPTLGQLGDEIGLASRSTVAYHLDKLQAKGLIQRDGQVIRGVRVAAWPPGHARQELRAVPGRAA